MSKKRITNQKANGFIIPVSTIEEMNKLNHKTYETGREHALALCLDKRSKQVVPGNSAIGNEVSVYFEPKCKDKKNQKYVGNFHTHPEPSETKFSAADLVMACNKKEYIDCVGMDSEGNIACYMRKRNGNDSKTCLKDANALMDIEDMYGKLSMDDEGVIPEAVLYNVDKIVDKKFTSKKIL